MGSLVRKLVVRLVLAACGLAAVVVAARLVMFLGLLAPVRIISGSMAETLPGQHFRVVCADCGFEFRCDRAVPPGDMQAVCPNCCYAENAVDAKVWQPGQRVLIDQLLTAREPQRWEVIAFDEPERPERLTVKRVVGLPGEQVGTLDGDLYIDGRIARKDLARQREMAILVHDNDFRAGRKSGELPSRWESDRADSHWDASGERIVFSPGESREPGDAPLDWLTYRHFRFLEYPVPRVKESAPRDSYAYNQEVPRELHVATDLMFVGHVRLAGAGRFVVRINNGRDVIDAVIEPDAERLSWLLNGNERGSVAWPSRFNDRSFELVVSVFDRQALVAVDGETLLQVPYDRIDDPLAPTSRPIALGARDVEVEIEHLRIYRDVYYLNPHRSEAKWNAPHRLGDDELFVLGDNPPISRDSRLWKKPLKRDALVGAVTPVP